MFNYYIKTPLVTRVVIGFVLGAILGSLSYHFGWNMDSLDALGDVFIDILKAVVVPVVALSLVFSTMHMEGSDLGRRSLQVLGLYAITVFIAASLGLWIALMYNAGSGLSVTYSVDSVVNQAPDDTSSLLYDTLRLAIDNVFHALSTTNFIGIIVSSIAIGCCLRAIKRESPLSDVLSHLNDGFITLVKWVMELAPFGIFGLVAANFSQFGASLFGQYIHLLAALITTIVLMAVVIYPLVYMVVTRTNPLPIAWHLLKTVGLTAFATRSSVATLPVSINTMDNLGVPSNLSRFTLSIGATVNMAGAAITVSTFSVVAANLFAIDLSATHMVVLVLISAIASIGVGGVPSGSLMLLFVALHALNLSQEQAAMIVGIAFTLTAIQDSFETALNVYGDNIITHAIAKL